MPLAVIAAIRRTGRYGISSRGSRGFLRLEAPEPQPLGPLLGFPGDEAAKVGGRARNPSTAQIGEPCLKLGIGEARVDLLVELVDDLGRRGLRCVDAEPDGRLI